MNGFKSIISKELTRVFKDRKLIFSMFILPIILVIGIMGLVVTLMTNMQKDIEAHISTVYIQNAPEDFKAVISKVENMKITFLANGDSIDSIKENIVQGTDDLIVVFPADFATATLPEVKTFYNPSEDNSNEARARMIGYLESYRQALVADRFGSVEATMIFTVDTTNAGDSSLVDSSKATGKMLGMIVPYFITMMIFAGAMGLGIDSIAGEKERGTLASLLMTPVKRVSIVMGKLTALGLLSIMSAAIYLIGMFIAFRFMGNAIGDEAEALSGLTISFDTIQVVELVVLILGVVLMYVSIIGLVSVLSKNIKEAQSYIMPVYMIVIVAGMVTMFTTDSNSFTNYMIPLFNSSVAFKGIFTKEITIPEYMTVVLITYGISAALIGLTAKAFKSEKIMFNA